MSRLLVNIRGCNGSGKSTIPISMMDDPKKYIVTKEYQGKQKRILTVFPTYKWVALGSYLNKTGGLDVLPNNDITQKTLWYTLKKFPDYDILMEGIMASTIRSTYIKLFHEVEEKYPDTKVIIFNLMTPLQVCLNRIQMRNGGKSIKKDRIEEKWKTVNRNIQYFKDEGFITLKVDPSRLTKDRVLDKFLATVERYRGG